MVYVVGGVVVIEWAGVAVPSWAEGGWGLVYGDWGVVVRDIVVR